jgi:hypothetical protein
MSEFRLTRRAFLRGSAALTLAGAARSLPAANESVGSILSPWTPGTLDIHHINTGRGNSALMVCPDGTSVLMDAGASNSAVKYLNPARPDDRRRAGTGLRAMRRGSFAPQEVGSWTMRYSRICIRTIWAKSARRARGPLWEITGLRGSLMSKSRFPSAIWWIEAGLLTIIRSRCRMLRR